MAFRQALLPPTRTILRRQHILGRKEIRCQQVSRLSQSARPVHLTSSLRASSSLSSSTAKASVNFTQSTAAGASSPQQFSSSSSNHNKLARVYLAVGSNLGHRFQNIDNAITMLSDPSFGDSIEPSSKPAANSIIVNLVHTSMLHETAPMYVTDQPSFLNGVVEVETNLSPIDLLRRIKLVEAQMGRDLEGGIRYGPRPVDLDILLYHHDDDDEDENNATAAMPIIEGEEDNFPPEMSLVMDTPDLTIPHPRMTERDFVMAPLCEVAGLNNGNQFTKGAAAKHLHHPVLNQSMQNIYQELQNKMQTTDSADGSDEEQQRVVVLPLPRDRMLYLNETVIMGILNVTPDSFSDGGKWNASLEVAVQRALEMIAEGASIIDIGGESTRPGAKEVAIDEEMSRTIPVIQRIREASLDIPISIDTRHAVVAKAAIKAGADIVNDVSGGTFDPDMLSTVAELRVPIVLMHMKGTPETMQTYVNDYTSVVDDVTHALLQQCAAAEAAGIPRWMQIVDPGIGFGKDMEGNLSLLKHLNTLRDNMGMSSTPILLGTSRKGFIGKLTGAEGPENRDFGSIASCVAAMCLGNDSSNGALNETSNILRVHNVKAMKDAAVVMDYIRRAT